MPEIAIDFLRGADLSSRLIAWFGIGAGGYSHCASVLADGRYLDARWDRLGGVPPGVHIRSPDTEPWSKRRRATLEVTAAEYTEWELNLRAKITDGYGVADILAFLDPCEQHVDGRWICSAVAINAVQHIRKVAYPFWLAAHQIIPDMCLSIVQAAGFTIHDEETR